VFDTWRLRRRLAECAEHSEADDNRIETGHT
jgi:hypothetical protein